MDDAVEKQRTLTDGRMGNLTRAREEHDRDDARRFRGGGGGGDAVVFFLPRQSPTLRSLARSLVVRSYAISVQFKGGIGGVKR